MIYYVHLYVYIYMCVSVCHYYTQRTEIPGRMQVESEFLNIISCHKVWN